MADPGDESHAPASVDGDNTDPKPTQTLTKTAQKKLLKLEGLAARKAEKKAAEKQRKAEKKEKRRRNWNEKFESLSPEEKAKLLESNKEATWERIKREKEEHRKKIERLNKAAEVGQKVLLDLDFGDHMTANEIQSLSQQIIFCYGANSRSTNPTHLWLTGCTGEMEARLKKIPGFDKWLIEKETRPYIEALSDQKENLVYLTADSENVLEELDSKSIYIIGGLVDQNRFKGITLDKAKQQGIKSAKLPIGNYLKMSSSQTGRVHFLRRYHRERDNAEGETLGEEKVATQDAADVVAVTKEDEKEDLERVIEEGSVSKKQCIRETKDGEHMASEDNNTTEDNSLVNDNGNKELL